MSIDIDPNFRIANETEGLLKLEALESFEDRKIQDEMTRFPGFVESYSSNLR